MHRLSAERRECPFGCRGSGRSETGSVQLIHEAHGSEIPVAATSPITGAPTPCSSTQTAICATTLHNWPLHRWPDLDVRAILPHRTMSVPYRLVTTLTGV